MVFESWWWMINHSLSFDTISQQCDCLIKLQHLTQCSCSCRIGIHHVEYKWGVIRTLIKVSCDIAGVHLHAFDNTITSRAETTNYFHYWWKCWLFSPKTIVKNVHHYCVRVRVRGVRPGAWRNVFKSPFLHSNPKVIQFTVNIFSKRNIREKRHI